MLPFKTSVMIKIKNNKLDLKYNEPDFLEIASLWHTEFVHLFIYLLTRGGKQVSSEGPSQKHFSGSAF